MDPFDFIKCKQRIWAKNHNIELMGSKIDKGELNYTKTLRDNLFLDISDESRREFTQGDGNELAGFPAKMQALHSSSALTVNFFEFWKKAKFKKPIAKALRIPSTNILDIKFEKKFPILPNSMRHPNIDVVFNYKNGYCCAIECKFTEPYQQSRKTISGLKEKYISEFEHWDSIPTVFQLAKVISPNDTKFNYLYSAQLVKHVLGLLTKYDKSKFRLLYVWYDAFGEKSYRHSLELEELASIFRSDGITFQAITWQEVIINLSSYLSGNSLKYLRYLEERYL